VFASSRPVLGVLSVGGLVMAAMYLLGIAAAVLVAFTLKRTLLRSPRPTLMMELPPYRRPSARAVGRRLVRRARAFTFQTGSVILALSVLLWALLAFPRHGMPAADLRARRASIEARTHGAERRVALERLAAVDGALQLEHSYGGRVGRALEPFIRPLGFDWKIGIGLISSFAAREVMVSTMATIYNLESGSGNDASASLRRILPGVTDARTGLPVYTPLVAVSLMVFFALACQCMSTVAVVRRETNSWRWPIFMLVLMNVMAWGASFVVYQGGRALGWG